MKPEQTCPTDACSTGRSGRWVCTQTDQSINSPTTKQTLQSNLQENVFI